MPWREKLGIAANRVFRDVARVRRSIRSIASQSIRGLALRSRPVYEVILRLATAQLHCRVYALSYLICIPIFALLYSVSAGDFYHSTVQHEKSLGRDLEAIRKQLTDVLNRHIGMQYGKTPIVDHGWELRGNTVTLRHARVENNAFEFGVEVDLIEEGKEGAGRLRGTPITMRIGPEFTPMINDEGEMVWVMKRVEFSGEFALGFDPYALLVNPPAEFKIIKSEMPFLPIPAALNQRMVEYTDALDGFPSKTSGNFSRMLYFSVVTITTLGFGDIVPLTPWTRFLVALEAILGVILVGYYLASLANSLQPRTDDRREGS